jgi:hypothetical protein
MKPKTKIQKARRPGAVPPGKVGVYDRENRLRGHVTKAATSVSAARFTGEHGAVLGKVKGRTSWTFPK